MQANTQLRILMGEASGFFSMRLIHHQTCLRQKASLVLKDNRFVDSRTAAKIVASEDQGFQNVRRSLHETSSVGRIERADNS